MQVGYFTERPYRWLPEEVILKNQAFFAISNKLYDREKAADDGIMSWNGVVFRDVVFKPGEDKNVGEVKSQALPAEKK